MASVFEAETGVVLRSILHKLPCVQVDTVCGKEGGDQTPVSLPGVISRLVSSGT